jgi:biotin transporter BioY
VVNWEAVALIGGMSILICFVLSLFVISIRRSKTQREGPLEVSVPPAGVVLASLQVVSMLAGIIMVGLVPETPFGWARLAFCLVYFPGTFAAIVLLDSFLEKRGVKVAGTSSEGSPPNKSLERTRDR